MKGHRNIPIFIPHLGCPNQCVFCNQRSISGCRSFCEEDVVRQIETVLSENGGDRETEIAFFGGSFTGIDRELMLRLLKVAQRYVDTGDVSGIRMSTRPDYISKEILDILSAYTVNNIELGLQSMDDRVLLAAQRGHTAKDAEEACRAIISRGIPLTGQMMIGLPEATPESEVRTARRLCEMGVSFARIYPTVVFYGTPLCDMARTGAYTPLSLEDAVERSANAYEVFLEAEIPCIRIGLCASEELISPELVYAGPNHPALGELVMSEAYYRKIVAFLTSHSLLGKEIVLEVPERELSRAVGQHRANVKRLLLETGTRVLCVTGSGHADRINAYSP
ncbi:MAG: radical SAM protein [Ruminococcaceae bacterium]|nr:radical SAM protein [Oscillospiraceae bacterium]